MWLRLFTICMFSVQSLFSYEVSIISMFKNEGPYLKEWVEFHRIAGVEHFFLYNNNSTDSSLEVLQPYIDEALVELIDWPYQATNGYVGIQIKAFTDGFKRCLGRTKWVACIDIDEFIVPIRGYNIQECLKIYFADANAIYLNWRNFGTSNVIIPLGNPLITQLLMCSLSTHSDNGIGKSIIRPEVIEIQDTWYPHHFRLKPEYNYVNGSNKQMTAVGWDLKTDGFHHNKYLVIHHYCLRDEWFYQNARLAKAKKGIGDISLLQEHHESFNSVPNNDAVDFLRKKHPKEFEQYWGLY